MADAVKYQADFDTMSDAEIAYSVQQAQDQVDEAEEWLEAVAAWEAAGRPRTDPTK